MQGWVQRTAIYKKHWMSLTPLCFLLALFEAGNASTIHFRTISIRAIVQKHHVPDCCVEDVTDVRKWNVCRTEHANCRWKVMLRAYYATAMHLFDNDTLSDIRIMLNCAWKILRSIIIHRSWMTPPDLKWPWMTLNYSLVGLNENIAARLV